MRSAVINRLLAERLWGDQDPVGRRLLLSGNPEPLAVVGVVGATRDGGLDQSGSPAVYLPVLPRGGTIVLLADSNPPRSSQLFEARSRTSTRSSRHRTSG